MQGERCAFLVSTKSLLSFSTICLALFPQLSSSLAASAEYHAAISNPITPSPLYEHSRAPIIPPPSPLAHTPQATVLPHDHAQPGWAAGGYARALEQLTPGESADLERGDSATWPQRRRGKTRKRRDPNAWD
eukprot:4007828-Pleurochrysis_carterae.AAC.12